MNSFQKSIRREKGFTLIEVMVTLSLISFVIILIVVTLINSSNTFTFINKQQIATDESDNAIQSINGYIRSALNTINQYSYDSTIYSLSSSTLILNVPSIDINGNVIMNENDIAIFYYNDYTLRQIIIPGNTSNRPYIDKIIVNNVGELAFDVKYIGNATIVTTSINTKANIEGNINSFKLTSGEILYNR